MNWEDGVRSGFDLNGATIAGKVNRATNRLSINSETDHRTAAQEGVASTHVFAPIIVVEFLVIRDVDISAINAYRHITTHLIRPANEWQFITTVEVTIVLNVSIHGVGKIFNGIHTSSSNECRRFAIRVWDVG